jgi:alpha-tubulin suppressor-like RCC1 family protein
MRRSRVVRSSRLLSVFAAFVASVSVFTTPALAQKAAGGANHTLIVKSDGTLWAIGDNSYGQLGDGSNTLRARPVQVPGLANVESVAAGGNHSMALTSAGVLYLWGSNATGQLGNGSSANSNTPVQSALADVIAIAAGRDHSLALQSDGDLYAWGANTDGQLGNGNTVDQASPALVATGVAAIAGGRYHSVFAKADGTAYAMGHNYYGELGDGTRTLSASPVQMSGVSAATRVWAGDFSSFILLSDGTVMAVGENGVGTLGDGTTSMRLTPVSIPNLANVTSLAVSTYHVLVRVSDGTIYSWGFNSNGQLGDGTTTQRVSAALMATPTSVAHVGAGHGHSVAVSATGVVYTWGNNAWWQLGDGTNSQRLSPGSISGPDFEWSVAAPTVSVPAGIYTVDQIVTVATATAGATIHYTVNGVDPTTSDPTIASGGTLSVTQSQTLKARAVKAGMADSPITVASYEMKVALVAFTPEPTTYSSPQTVSLATTTPGATIRYTLDGSAPSITSAIYTAPVTVATSTVIKALGFKSNWTSSTLAAGEFALNFGTLPAPTANKPTASYVGTVWVSLSNAVSGATIRYTTDNTEVQPSSTAYASPLAINANTTLRFRAYHPDYSASSEATATYSITPPTAPTHHQRTAGGQDHSLVVDANGSVWAFGENTYGQLGDGSNAIRATPVQISGLSNVVAVAAGGNHSMALTAGGSVYVWGRNSSSQLGNGTTTSTNVPVQLGLTDIVAIAAGRDHSLALQSDGEVFVWGSNAYGQLGLGDTTDRSVPTPVTTGARAIAGGRYHSVFVKLDGTVHATGGNWYGALGDDTNTGRTTAAPMLGITTATAAWAGDFSTFVLLTNGSLVAAGENGSCTLGDGTTTTRRVAVPILELTNVTQAAISTYHIVVTTGEGTAFAWGYNYHSGVGDGSTVNRCSPVALATISSVEHVGAGHAHSLALTAGGVVYSWGGNQWRALGDGTVDTRSAPTAISASNLQWNVASPALNIPAGTFNADFTVWLTTETAGATIHYTQNGVEPTTSDPTVASGSTVTISYSQTVKAKAFKAGMPPSTTSLRTYEMKAADVTATPSGGTYSSAQSVALTTSTAGATIRFTTDGTAPTESSPSYSTPIQIAASTTLRAAAFKTGWSASTVAVHAFSIPTLQLDVTSITPAAGSVGVRSQAISATFSAAMDPDSLTQSTVMLESVLGEWTLYTTPSYDAATRTVTLIVDDWIEPLALHRVRIVGGIDGVRSATGMLLGSDFEWTFTAASDDGVGGMWGFEEGNGVTTADSSGNGNTGTLLGPSWSGGRYGSGLTFDGVDDRIRIADAETLDATTAVSIAAWVKPNDVRPLSVILSKESVSADHSYALRLNSSGQLSANFVLSGTVFAATSSSAIPTNVWAYVIATYDGALIRLYVNGEEVASSPASGTFESTTGPLWIGGDQSADHYFSGHIDEVRVFDYAMAEWEIGYWMAAPVKLLQTAGRASGGVGHTLLAKDDGTVWAWGDNGNGQLGDSGTNGHKTPLQVAGLSNIVAVAAGRNHSIALAADGIAYAWGDNASGQVGANTEGADQLTPLALPLTSVTAIDAGDLFSLLLRANGEVYAFGRNANGQFGVGTTASSVTTPTLVATGAVAIAAGFNHSVIVKADGTVWTAGQNDSGQLGNNSTTPSTSWVQMAGINTGVAATAGERHTVVLLADGMLRATGINTSGQLGDSTTAPLETTAVPIYAFEGVTVIDAGANHTIATTSDGYVWTWGQNTSGQLGNDSTTMSRQPLWQPFYTAHIGAGHQHSVAVTPSRTVYTWGNNSHGQLGNGIASTVSRLAPVEISADEYAWRVAAPAFSPEGGSFSNEQVVTLASETPDEPGLPVTIRYTLDGGDPTESSTIATGPITVDHALVMKARAWKNNMPTSDVNTASFTFQAAQPTAGVPAGTYTAVLHDVEFLSATQGAQIRYTTDLTDPTASSTLYTGPIDIAHTTTYRIAAFKGGYTRSPITQVQYTMNFGTLPAPVVEPAAGTYLGSVTVATSTPPPGLVYYTVNPAAAAGDAPTNASFSLSPLTLTTTATIRARSIHPDYSTSPDATRTYIIKANKPSLSAAGGSYAPGSVVTVTADQPSFDTLRMTIDGSEPSELSTVVASGSSILLGNFTVKVRAFREHPDDIDSDTESAVYSLTSPLGPGSASAGGAHSVLATPDGRVFAWGRNGNGQLGIDSTTDKSTPTLMNGITGVTSVSSGAAHSLARTWDGKVYAWGANGSGRLGDGTTMQRAQPIHVSTLTNVVAVAAGDMHSLALTSDGHVYAWGENSDGQVGGGSTFDASMPRLVASLTNVVAIAAGGTHSLAVTASGELYAWGNNANSQLGDGTTIDRTNPALIGVSDVVAIAAGGSHSLAMTSSGAVYSWGLGSSGQLGQGAVASTTTPQMIPGIHASAIAAGKNHSAAIRHDGVLVAWGAGTSGQIGDGAASQRNAPVVVNGPVSVSTLTLGDSHSLAVTPAGEISTWGEVDFGRLGDTSTQDRLTPAAISPAIASWAPAVPTISVASGTFATAQSVTVVASEAGAVIRYTLNGAEPTDSDPEVPASGILGIASPSQLRAKVYATGRAASATARANYVLQPSAPLIDPPTGSYLTTQTVTIWGSGPSSVIRYTLNGSEPTATSTLYEVPFDVGVTTIVKAREFPANGWNPSATATSSLVFNGGALDLPTASPAGGTFSTAPQVSLSSIAEASIRYTLDGSTPTAASTLYTGPLAIPAAGATLKSIAFHPTLPSSGVRTDAYVIDVAAPTIIAQYHPAQINSWSRSAVEVRFVCSDNQQVALCSPPTTFTEEGAGQAVTGTALDDAGNQTQLPVSVNVDFTPPVVTLTAPVDGLVTAGSTVVISAEVDDALSGLGVVNCNGVATAVVDGLVTCTVTLRPGRNSITVSAQDAAGNSSSAGATVTLAGTPTRLTLTPTTRLMLIGESATLSLRDNFGVPAPGAMWTSSMPWVVSLSPGDPPVLTALATGTVTITATKNGLSRSATVTVVSDPNLAEGTTRWTVAPTPNLVWFEGPIYTHRTDASVPDFFMVETNTSTFERTLRAVSESGEADWLAASPGVPLMGDTFGGVIAGVEPVPNHCVGPFNEIQRCYTALARFAGPVGSAEWRYDSAGLLDRPAQGPDGTIYVIEHLGEYLYQPNNHGNAYFPYPGQKVLVILDGANGAVTARVPLEGDSNYEPVTAGPIVGSDGFGYVLTAKGLQLTLHQFSRDGQAASAVIVPATCSGGQCRQPVPGQLLPNGLGGLLITADWGNAAYLTTDLRLTQFDSNGVRTDTATPHDTGRIDLIGVGGFAYLRESLAASTVAQPVMDLSTLTTRWHLPVEWKLLAATPGGGAVAQNAAGDIAHFDGTGQLQRTIPAVGLRNPVHESGGLIGASGLAPNTPHGLRKVEGTFEDATYFSARYAPQLWTGTEQYGFGAKQGRNAPPLVPNIALKCRPIAAGFPADEFVHCYIVVKNEDGSLQTIEAGEATGQMSGTLVASIKDGDAAGTNRSTDPVYDYFDDDDSDPAVISCLKANTIIMHSMHLDYFFLGPNSNRFVVEVLGACGRNVLPRMPWRAIGARTPFNPPMQ